MFGVSLCVRVGEHADIFAHTLARVLGDVMEKGRNATDRVGQEEEEEEECSSSSTLYFTLSLCLFVQRKKES